MVQAAHGCSNSQNQANQISITEKSLVKIFKALGDETRLRIVRMLVGKELCACAFLTSFSMTQPALSNHLRVLRENGIIIHSREGRWVFYKLNPDTFKTIEPVLKNMLFDIDAVRIAPVTELCTFPEPKHGIFK